MFRLMTLVALCLVAWMLWRTGSIVPYATDYVVPVSASVASFDDQKGALATLQVIANDYTVNNEPWDGSETFGGMMGPFFASIGFSSPPDLTACVVALSSEAPTCATQPRDGRATSNCVNARSCEWDLVVPPDQPFGLVIFDMDDGLLEGPWDFVDAVLVSDTDDPERLGQLDAAVRDFVAEASPTELTRPSFAPAGPPIPFNEGEKYRRERPLLFMSRAQIAEGYELLQSSIVLIGH